MRNFIAGLLLALSVQALPASANNSSDPSYSQEHKGSVHDKSYGKRDHDKDRYDRHDRRDKKHRGHRGKHDRKHHGGGKGHGHGHHHHGKPGPTPEPTPEPTTGTPAPSPSFDYENGADEDFGRFHLYGRAPSEDGGNDQKMMSAVGTGSISPHDLVSTCPQGCWKLRSNAQSGFLDWTHIGPFFTENRAGVDERDVRE